MPFLDSYSSLKLNINATQTIADIKGNGLYLNQIFGPLTLGKGYNAIWSTDHEECYRAGILVILCQIVSVIYLVKSLITKKAPGKYFLQLFCFGLLASWMSSVYFPWDVMPSLGGFGRLMAAVQYPSRYLLVQLICFAICGVLGLKGLMENFFLKTGTLMAVALLALATTGVFHYTLSFGVNMTDERAADDWADKLYLPIGTDSELLSNTDIIMENGQAVLPVLGYKNLKVFNKTGKEIESTISTNNCLAVEDGENIDMDNISIRYVEPVLWRISEAITVIAVLLLFAAMIKETYSDKRKF